MRQSLVHNNTGGTCRLAMTLIFCLGIVGCDDNGPALQQVMERGDQLFTSEQAGNMDAMLAQYDEQFFAAHSRDDWRRQLETTRRDLGDLRSFTLRQKHYDTRLSGRFFIFEYQVIYDRGSAWETLTFINPNNSPDIRLVGHQIKEMRS